jgi:chromosome segregation ATPase
MFFFIPNDPLFACQEMKEMKTRVDGMTSRVLELETTNSSLQRRIGELKAQIEEMGRMHRYASVYCYYLGNYWELIFQI